jgi:xylono-1,5-lactonase
MTVDDEGVLWVALGRARGRPPVPPRRHLNGMVELPVTNPTSVASGGIGGPTLHHDLVVRLRT